MTRMQATLIFTGFWIISVYPRYKICFIGISFSLFARLTGIPVLIVPVDFLVPGDQVMNS